MTADETRLNKYLAHAMGISRREADSLIEKGGVRVDDSVAVLGTHLTASSKVSVDGKPVTKQDDYQYVAFHKPVGYVCSRKAQGDNPTIYSLLPQALHDLKPVGRLDKDSSGILLLTNDGDFAHHMTHPSFYKTKTYHVSLDRELEPLHQQMISDYGITLEDGRSQFVLERQSEDNRRDWIITMHEGRNRQIRRTFAALGYSTKKLHRVQFGAYSLDSLSSGETRPIEKK